MIYDVFVSLSVKSWVRKDFGRSKLSKLYVANVNRNDSGWYTCSMGRYGNATVFVSILNGNGNGIIFILYEIKYNNITSPHVIKL